MPAEGIGPSEVEIEEHDGFLEARFLGIFKLDRFKRQVDAAVHSCREKKLSLLLLDASRLQGKLSTLDRFELGEYGARTASNLRVAVFGVPGLLDSKKFAATVAQNRGLSTDTFTDRQKAIDWLLTPP